MGYEIDFLGVGEESKSGDAIALRYGNLHGSRAEQTVVVIDGGFQNTGAKLVEHIIAHYGTSQVDLVINTHADPKHPRKAVMNAFTHRGVKALVTRGSGICHQYNAPGRDGWNSMNPELYHFDYEEEVA